MWQVHPSIQVNTDTWPILEVDCFTKPHAIVMDCLKPGLYDTYLYYCSLAKSYGFSHLLREGEEWSFEIHPYVARMCGVNYVFHHCANPQELRRLILDKLDQGIPVLVPGNLRHLYYTWAYQRTDAFHLFLVKGCEKELELYSINDNMHIMAQPIPDVVDESGTFADFVIPMATLEEVWCGLKNLPSPYYTGKAITLEQAQPDQPLPSTEQKLEMFSQFASMQQTLLRYRELSIMQFALDFFRESGEPVEGQERNFRFDIIFANKQGLLKMVLSLLEEVANEDEVREAEKLVERIQSSWARLKSIFYLHLMRGTLSRVEDLEPIFQPILDLEKKFMYTIKETLTKR